MKIRWNVRKKEEKPEPVESDAENFQPTVRRSWILEEVNVRLYLKVETSKTHDYVIGEVLELQQTRGDPCVRENPFVVRRVERTEKSWRHRKERQMLNIYTNGEEHEKRFSSSLTIENTRKDFTQAHQDNGKGSNKIEKL